MKQIQIPEQLFMELVKFHLLDMEENLPSIKQGLEAKLDSLVMRDLYSKYKTAPTEEEREQARKEYLDRRGTDKSRGKNSDMACRMGRKYRRPPAVSHRKSSPDTGREKGRIRP